MSLNALSEVLVQFEVVLVGPDGTLYTPCASGRETRDGRWEGWIEFVPSNETPVLSSPKETIQPNRTDLAHWAAALTLAYLEGALQRAWDAQVAIPRVADAMPPATSPAPPRRSPVDREVVFAPHAVLDPYEVYAQGEEVLRRQLRALDIPHLQQIVRAYSFTTLGTEDSSESSTVLETAILAGVKSRARR